MDKIVCNMSDDGRCVVDKLKVGREGYGNV
jgi:hypothetical protein